MMFLACPSGLVVSTRFFSFYSEQKERVADPVVTPQIIISTIEIWTVDKRPVIKS